MKDIDKELSTILRKVVLFDEKDKLETELIENIKELFKESVPLDGLVMQKNAGIKKGTIVQITNEQHHWFPCLIIVDEIKNWGIQGYMTMPSNDREKTNGNAFIRLKNEEFEIVGKANIVIE